MDSALAWIGQIAEWIGKFFPRWLIIDPTDGGVKYPRGKTVLLKRGVNFWWPVTTPNPTTYPIARQADDLRTQTIVTTDDKVIVIGGMVVYQVVDVLKLLPRVFRASHAVKEIVLTCIHEVCCQMSWDELKSEQREGTLDTKLKNAARKQLEEYGVDVIKVQLTDLAPARVLKLMQTTEE